MSEILNPFKELTNLTAGLDSIRKKGSSLGLYGLNESQASLVQSKFVPTKSLRQIKTAVFAAVNEHTLTTNRLPMDAWNELFMVRKKYIFYSKNIKLLCFENRKFSKDEKNCLKMNN